MSAPRATTTSPPNACMAARTSLAGGRPLAPDQDLGAELEVALGGHLQPAPPAHRRLRRRVIRAAPARIGIALDVAHHPLDHAHKALPAGIDHSRFLEHGHQLGRPSQRRLALREQPRMNSPMSRRLAGDRAQRRRRPPARRSGWCLPAGRPAMRRAGRRRCLMARAISGAVAVARSPSDSVKPRRKCASIIPELPRAPSTAARAMVRAVSGSDASPSARRASATARRVRLKLVPVSPSGTGKTLIRLISSRPAATQSAAAKTRAREPGTVDVRDADAHRRGVTPRRPRRARSA